MPGFLMDGSHNYDDAISHPMYLGGIVATSFHSTHPRVLLVLVAKTS